MGCAVAGGNDGSWLLWSPDVPALVVRGRLAMLYAELKSDGNLDVIISRAAKTSEGRRKRSGLWGGET